MKKILKFLGIIFLLLLLFLVGYYLINNEKLPEGQKGAKADELAMKVLKAINNEAYQKVNVLEWSFRGAHHYKWFKQKDIVEVSWSENKVILHTKTPEKNEVYANHEKVSNQELIEKATAYFNNDSFWLIAPHKIFDAGVERQVVNYNGKEALLVSYTSGGTTPGDSYLWILDDTGMPTSYKMWVKIIPMGGVAATWDHWKTTEAGIPLPTQHTLSLFGMEIPMGDVKAYN